MVARRTGRSSRPLWATVLVTPVGQGAARSCGMVRNSGPLLSRLCRYPAVGVRVACYMRGYDLVHDFQRARGGCASPPVCVGTVPATRGIWQRRGAADYVRRVGTTGWRGCRQEVRRRL